MNCLEFRDQVHDFLDARLSARGMAAANAHLRDCPDCSRLQRGFSLIGESLSGRVQLPETAAQLALNRILTPRMSFGERLALFPTWLRSLVRDIDRPLLWRRVAAMPLALTLFALTLFQFAPAPGERLGLFLVSITDPQIDQRVQNVEVKQNSLEFREWMDTAWRLPYEDSLQLVAEVQPEGHLEVDRVLEYPKSAELLLAVDAALKTSRFQSSMPASSSLVIFSFQKIDVYDRRGL